MALAIISDMRKQHDNQSSSQFLIRPADYINVLLILTGRVALLGLSQSSCTSRVALLILRQSNYTADFETVKLYC